MRALIVGLEKWRKKKQKIEQKKMHIYEALEKLELTSSQIK